MSPDHIEAQGPPVTSRYFAKILKLSRPKAGTMRVKIDDRYVVDVSRTSGWEPRQYFERALSVLEIDTDETTHYFVETIDDYGNKGMVKYDSRENG